MFKRLRIAILLYVLLFVALGQALDSQRVREWDNPLWVNVYLVNGPGSISTGEYLDTLGRDAYIAIEEFFTDQAAHYALGVDRPFRLRLAGMLENRLPPVPDGPGVMGAILWSLKMRWFVTRLRFSSDMPRPDITLFAIYHDADSNVTIDRSTALQKGMIAVANLFGSPAARGSNHMIIAHELLHTLGATDKYHLPTGLPVFPLGFADPDRKPLYPQTHAELMAGRIPIGSSEAEIAPSLSRVVIGPATAYEIGWIDTLDAAN